MLHGDVLSALSCCARATPLLPLQRPVHSFPPPSVATSIPQGTPRAGMWLPRHTICMSWLSILRGFVITTHHDFQLMVDCFTNLQQSEAPHSKSRAAPCTKRKVQALLAITTPRTNIYSGRVVSRAGTGPWACTPCRFVRCIGSNGGAQAVGGHSVLTA